MPITNINIATYVTQVSATYIYFGLLGNYVGKSLVNIELLLLFDINQTLPGINPLLGHKYKAIYRVTTESAAWLGPHRPSRPRPQIPVLPMGFLQKHTHTHVVPYLLHIYCSGDQESIWEISEQSVQL